MKKQSTYGVLTLAAMILVLNACGVPQPTQAARPGNTANSSSQIQAETTAAKDPGVDAEKDKEKAEATKAERQANLRRDIQLKKDTLSRTQQNLTRTENILSSQEGRLNGVNLNKAGVVPAATSGSVLGSLITENYAGAIAANASKKSAKAAADKTIANLSTLETSLMAEIEKTKTIIADLENQVDQLDQEIVDMTEELNTLE